MRSVLTTCLLALLTGAVFALAVLAQDRTQIPTLVVVALSGCGVLAWLWWRQGIALFDVLLFAVVFRLALVWLPPSLSDDAFRYVWDGLVQAQHVNPYEFRPEAAELEALHGEVLYERLNSKSFYSVYPPVSQYVFAFGSMFYGQGWMVSHYVIKGILVLAELVALLILARLVGARSLMLYAWNPLVLLETAGQGHTESLLLLFLIAVICASRAGKGTWASIALAGATWVKLFPVVLFPFVWRRFGWGAVWPGAVALGVFGIPFAAPYVLTHATESLELYARLFEFNAGFYYAIKQVYFWFTEADYSKQIGPALRWCFLMGLPALYALDYWRRWSLEKAFFVVIGLYLVLSTTVHPWYLLSVFFLAAFLNRPAWPWYWIGAFSIGTYMLYVGGPYWEFVIVGWGGGLVLVGIQHGQGAVLSVLRYRARQKVRFIRPYLPRLEKPLVVLELGCGEGFVGEHIQRAMQAEVALADIVDMNRTGLTHTLCEPGKLPWFADTFDLVVLYFVLHHAEDAAKVLQEARRVSRQRVIVVESVYQSPLGLKVLTALDKAANRMRHWRHMAAQEEHLAFRTTADWRVQFASAGMSILAEGSRGRLMHRQRLFVLE